MPEDLRAIVRCFFTERGKRIADDKVDLFETEIIDSMELMELLLHLEERHGISIAQELMTVANFRNIDAIVATAQCTPR